MRAIGSAAPPPVPASVPAVVAPAVAKEKKKKKKRRRRRAHPDDSRLYNLMLDVNALRSEVQRLEMSRDVMATRALVARENQRGVMFSTSARVFFAFRSGYRPQQWTPSEQDFMAEIFDENVALDATSTGRHALFEQWRLYTELFRMTTYRADAVYAQVVGDGGDDAYVVEARGAFSGRMTFDALAAVFPHVLDDHELVATLVGRALCCPLRTRLHFDRSGRITKYLVDADMLTAISHLVGHSMELTAALMAHARINEASMIEAADAAAEGGYDREGEASRESEPDEGEPSSPADADWTADAGTNGSVSHRQSIAYILS